MRKRFLFIFLAIILTGIIVATVCAFVVAGFSPGLQDYSYELTGGYTLYRTSAHGVSISTQSDSISTKPGIPSKVVEVAWDSRFIIAKQNPFKSRNKFSGDNYEIPDESIVNYWILDTSIPRVYGPFEINEFTESRRKLAIPEYLTLRSVEYYKGK